MATEMQVSSASVARGTRRRGVRAALAVLTAGIPALLLVQVYLAGLFLMGGAEARDAHVTVGRLLFVYPIALLPVAALGRAGSRFWLALAAFWVATLFQSLLPQLSPDDASGWLRALHPLIGVVLVGLGLRLTRAAWANASTDA